MSDGLNEQSAHPVVARTLLDEIAHTLAERPYLTDAFRMLTLSGALPKPRPSAPPEPWQLVIGRHGLFLANSLDFYLGRAMLEYGEMSEAEAAVLRQLLFKPGRVVEVGANAGYHTVPLARAAAERGTSVEAFEPQTVMFQTLCANLALNGLTNVRSYPFACGETTGTVHFTPPNYAASGNFGAVAMSEAASPGATTVPCVRLDDMLGPEPVALLKIDVEGFELAVLKGAQTLLARSRPVLYVENDRRDRSVSLIAWLRDHGYRLFWHLPPMFNPENFFRKVENIYLNTVSINMLCLPGDVELKTDLIEILSPTDLPPGVARG